MEFALQLLAPVAGVVVVFAASAVLRLPRRYLVRRAQWTTSRRTHDPDGLRPNTLTMAWSVLGALVLGILLVGGFGFGAYWLLGRPRLPTTTTLGTTELFDLLKITLSVVAGFGGVVALTVAYRKQHVAEATHRLALKQEDREQGKLLYERFITASANLGEDKFPSRLAGVHTLAALADQSTELRQQCVDVLCGYLRTLPPEGDRTEYEVRRAALRILLVRMSRQPTDAWRYITIDLHAALFDDVDLTAYTFVSGAIFDGIVFRGDRVSFAEIDFGDEASFRGTHFTSAHTGFQGSLFRKRPTFAGATFSGTVDFSLMSVVGSGIDFSGVVAIGAELDFTEAAVKGVLDFRGADLTDARILLDSEHIQVWTTGATLTGSYIGLPENAEAAQGRTP